MIAEVLRGKITEDQIPYHTDKDGLIDWDSFEIFPNTLLQKIVQSENWHVNSYHTQAVIHLPETFVVSAISKPDQVIEAIEAIHKTFFVGVQFHPEKIFSKDKKSSKLLTYFIHKAKTYQKN